MCSKSSEFERPVQTFQFGNNALNHKRKRKIASDLIGLRNIWAFSYGNGRRANIEAFCLILLGCGAVCH